MDGNTIRHITKTRFESIEIPLPPLEVQQEIVAEIEGYQKVIDGARAVIDNYRPHIPVGLPSGQLYNCWRELPSKFKGGKRLPN